MDMEAISVDVRRRQRTTATAYESATETVLDLEADLVRARMIANLMDAQFEIGKIKFGLDSIIGLVPAVGDTISAIIGLYPLHIARKYKLGRVVQTRMAANVFADWLVGLVPVAGDVADVAFKSHLRNLRILEAAAAKRRTKA
jgi:hypothetical protein